MRLFRVAPVPGTFSLKSARRHGFLRPQLQSHLCSELIQEICDIIPELSTGGGTSDARFIAPTGCAVIELGPISKTTHQIDECVALKDLEQLCMIYLGILTQLLEE